MALMTDFMLAFICSLNEKAKLVHDSVFDVLSKDKVRLARVYIDIHSHGFDALMIDTDGDCIYVDDEVYIAANCLFSDPHP